MDKPRYKRAFRDRKIDIGFRREKARIKDSSKGDVQMRERRLLLFSIALLYLLVFTLFLIDIFAFFKLKDVSVKIEKPIEIDLEIPIQEEMDVRINETFYIQTTVPVKTMAEVPFNTPFGSYKVVIPIEANIPVDVPVKIDTVVPIPIDEKFHLETTIVFNESIPVSII